VKVPGFFGRATPRVRFGLARALKADKINAMTPRRLYVAAAMTLCALFYAGAALADPKGLWLAQDGCEGRAMRCGPVRDNCHP
jgi:hypothetical protein